MLKVHFPMLAMSLYILLQTEMQQSQAERDADDMFE